jgi:SEC-C motif-containing protein
MPLGRGTRKSSKCRARFAPGLSATRRMHPPDGPWKQFFSRRYLPISLAILLRTAGLRNRRPFRLDARSELSWVPLERYFSDAIPTSDGEYMPPIVFSRIAILSLPDAAPPRTCSERGDLTIAMANKTGRNELCSCGSGLKFKKCCGSTLPRSSAGEEAELSQENRPVTIVTTEDMLMNRIEREARAVASSFDRTCEPQFKDIDRIYSAAAALLYAGKLEADGAQDELRSTLAIVLTNALKSFTASASLLRGGWRIQPFQCIRNGYETMSVALHLFGRPQDLPLLKSDQLKSTSTVKSLNKLFPMLGAVWSDLSVQFVHAGRPFRHIQRGNLFTSDEADLWHCLGQLAFMVWFLYQVIELVFYGSAEEHKFWVQSEPGIYHLKLSTKMEELKTRLVETYKRFVPVENDTAQGRQAL